MVKSKKNRNTNLDVIKKISRREAIKSNPFEVHVNKSKFKILGQKSKNDVGLPGIARNKAIQKRKVTLLQEYKVQDKSNKFFDKRIGEHNRNMTKEDKIMARFTAEKMKTHNKSLFNLDDDVVLTHQGRTLEEIEQFEDPRSDDEDEDGRGGDKLDAEFVKTAHFGGGMLSVASKDGELSRKDIISQLIADSKKRKAEKQLLKESTSKLTEQLDTDWKDLLPLMNPIKKSTPAEERSGATPTVAVTAPPQSPAPVVDKNSFDYLVRELRYEATGKPSDKLKSPDEIVRQEKERLEKLEQERRRRMSLNPEEGKSKTSKQRTYKSADDLDDGFAIERIDDNDEGSGSENDNDEPMDENENEKNSDEEEDSEEDEESDQEIDKNKEKELQTSKKENSKESIDKSENDQKSHGKSDIEEIECEDEGENEEGTDSESDTDSFDDINDEDESEEDNDKNMEEMKTMLKNRLNSKDKPKHVSNKIHTEEKCDGESDKGDDDNEEEDNDKMSITKDKHNLNNSISKTLDDTSKENFKDNKKEKNGNKVLDESKEIKKGKTDKDNSASVEKNKNKNMDEKEEQDEGTGIGKKKSLRFLDDVLIKEIDNNEKKIDKNIHATIENHNNGKSILKKSNVNTTNEKTVFHDEVSEDISKQLKELGMSLPFTFDVPNTYEDLCTLLDGRNCKEIGIVMERMIKVNHWKLGADNKIKLNRCVGFLLQYLEDSVVVDEPKKCWQTLNVLTPFLFDLTLMDPDNSAQYVRGVIQEKYEAYSKHERKCPSLHSVLFLKLVSSLFPTSDARHYVTTPALVFLLHVLGKSCVSTPRDIAVSVFLCTLAVEYVHLSKRYLPELINFIRGLLLLACANLPIPIVKPFKPSFKGLLHITQDELNNYMISKADDNKRNESTQNSTKVSPRKNQDNGSTQSSPKTTSKINQRSSFNHAQTFSLTAEDFWNENKTVDFEMKLKVLYAGLKLIEILIDKYVHYSASYLIFVDICAVLKQLENEMEEVLKRKKDVGNEDSIVDERDTEKDVKIEKKKEKMIGKEKKNVRSGNIVERCIQEIDDGKGKEADKVEEVSKEIDNVKKGRKESNGTIEKRKENDSDIETKIKTDSIMETSDLIEDNDILTHLLTNIKDVIHRLDQIKKEHRFMYVAKDKEKPKVLRLFEPDIKPVLKFHTKGTQKEREKLLHKYKKEMKGAVRELRKDARFIQNVRMKATIQADNVRKRKVKEILGDCSTQEGEIRSLKRKK